MTDRIGDPQSVCPFVAFDDDRDHRGPGPDHRHRCFAETPAAPRALAHQAAYCLSAGFAGCPTFIDWARREAAPVRQDPPLRSLRGTPAARGGTVPADAASTGGDPGQLSDDADWAAPPSWTAGDPAQPPAAAPADQPWAGSEQARDEDLDAPPFLAGRASHQPPAPEVGDSAWAGQPEVRPSWAEDAGIGYPGQASEPFELPDDESPPRAAEPRRAPVGYAPVAASRTDRRPVAGGSSRSGREHREASTPAWEEPRRHDSYPTLKSRGGTRIPRPLAYALIVLVAGLALFTLPFLLSGLGGGDGSASPSPIPSASGEPTPEPTTTPEPTPEEVVYIVKSGDTLSKIAAAYEVTVDQILEANPDIKNPNQISVGDRIVIPQPQPSEIVDGEVTPEP